MKHFNRFTLLLAALAGVFALTLTSCQKEAAVAEADTQTRASSTPSIVGLSSFPEGTFMDGTYNYSMYWPDYDPNIHEIEWEVYYCDGIMGLPHGDGLTGDVCRNTKEINIYSAIPQETSITLRIFDKTSPGGWDVLYTVNKAVTITPASGHGKRVLVWVWNYDDEPWEFNVCSEWARVDADSYAYLGAYTEQGNDRVHMQVGYDPGKYYGRQFEWEGVGSYYSAVYVEISSNGVIDYVDNTGYYDHYWDFKWDGGSWPEFEDRW